jgi:hypothetical protein
MTGAAPPPLTFRASLTERILVTLCALFMGAIALFMLAAAVGGFVANFLIGLVLLVAAAIIVALTWLVAKEAVSRWRLYAHLDGETLTALLPRRRGFIDQPRDKVNIALADIESIETRFESFTSIGVTTGQQAYVLVKRDGDRILLGADREWVPPFFARLAEAIVARAGVAVVDLGMVDGDAGFLLVAFQSAPAWETPSLSAPEIDKRDRHRARTATIMSLLALVVVLAQALSRR